MPSITEIRAQIQALQKQEKDILLKEKDTVISQIKKQIAEYSLTASSLGFSGKKASSGQKAKTASSLGKLVKYKKGEETWSGGRGPKPKWVKALMDAGENIEKYKV